MKKLDLSKTTPAVIGVVLLSACLLSSPCLAGIILQPIRGPLSLDMAWPPQGENNPSWSPDGTKIAFSWGDGYTAWDPSLGTPNPDGSYIVTMTADGQAIRGPDNPLVNDVGWDNHSPDWSPDGNWIVYTGSRVGPAYISRVSLIDGTVAPITGTPNDPHRDDSMWHPHRAKWSPDATRIAYVGGDWWNIPNPEPYHVWLTDPEGSFHIDLTPDIVGYGVVWLSWNPEGTNIVFTQQGESGLFVLDVETKEITPLSLDLFPDSVVWGSWASDDSILFSAAGGIYDYQIDTQTTTQLTFGPDNLGDWHSTAGLVFSSARDSGARWDTDIYTAEPIPAPAALPLGVIGIGLAGWLCRRRTL